MANPSFQTTDRATTYTWAELSHIPSDRAQASQRIREDLSVIEFVRTGLVFGRTVITQIGVWKFQWKNIPLAMVEALMGFYDEHYFYYYPDSSINSYFAVYISDNQFLPSLQANGNFDLGFTCKEYGARGLLSSSSSSSSSSSFSSSSSG